MPQFNKAQQSRQAKTSAARNLPSSQGDSPQEITPKDIGPNDAAWADVTRRDLTSADPVEHMEALLDEAVEDTFPASDPPSLGSQLADQANAKCETIEDILLDAAIEMTFPASDPIAVESCEQFAREHRLAEVEPYHPPL